MKKLLVILTLLLSALSIFATEASINATMDNTWQTFRDNHPYGYQTVGLRHCGDDCIFVISEPAETVSPDAIDKLFKQYGGTTTIKKKEFGYGGWLSDVVGQIRFTDEKQKSDFTHDLFTLLYGTDYKAYYTDLDNPEQYVSYSHYQLNYSITAAELSTWFVDDNELLKDESGTARNILTWISSPIQLSNKLLFSVEDGFVVWLIDTKKIKTEDKLFKTNARKFALDSDLIIGAIGKKDGNVAIIARERIVPVSVLPPLRVETLTLLAATTDQNLAQSYERYNVFASKVKGNQDFAPIYLSDELWHTEYGNLLNIADQMLKSWSENGSIDYYDFNYPKPIDWAFNDGALEDLESKQLTYNWNTKGAGYVLEGDYSIYAINRTGSLPVSYFPDGLEGRVEAKVYDAEELAYDFFSQLNNPELVRVVQYAAFYQILNYFKSAQPSNAKTTAKAPSVPDYRVFDHYIEDILRLVGSNADIHETTQYKAGLERYKKKFADANDVTELLAEYIFNDPYGEFVSYLENQLSEDEYRDLVFGSSNNNGETSYQEYIDANVEIIRQYIDDYERSYGKFPYAEAAKYIVSPREIGIQIELLKNQELKSYATYESLLEKYYATLKELDEESLSLSLKMFGFKSDFGIDINKIEDDLSDKVFNRLEKILISYYQSPTSYSTYQDKIEALTKKWNDCDALATRLIAMQPTITKELESYDKKSERLMALSVDDKQQKAMGALNWLLTDATPYDEPSGEFYTSQLPQHKQWTKTPSMVCSFNVMGYGGYGGHNLDAHVTPIKTSNNVPKGKCRVSFHNGNRVITVAQGDMKNVTPRVLRQVERQVIEDGKLIDLPPTPPTRPKSVLMPIDEKRPERGLNVATLKDPETIEHATGMDGISLQTDIEFVNAEVSKVKEANGTPHQITLKPYNERQLIVEVDGEQKIVERSGDITMDINDYSSNVESELRDGYGVIILHEKSDVSKVHGYKAAQVNLFFPQEILPDAKQAVQSLFNEPSIKLDSQLDIKLDNQQKILRTISNRINQLDGINIKNEKIIISQIFNLNNHDRYLQQYSTHIAA